MHCHELLISIDIFSSQRTVCFVFEGIKTVNLMMMVMLSYK